MKKNIIIRFLSVLLFFGFVTVGCDDNIPPLNVDGIGVDSITFKDDLGNGLTLEEGSTVSIAERVNVFPENATDRAESYYSSDIDVATVNQKGDLTANNPGNSEITIMVGGKELSFSLTVKAKVIIPPTSIEFGVDKLEIMLGVECDVRAQLTIKPYEANDDIIYESSDTKIVTVDADGIANGVALGEATITAYPKRNPSLKASVPVKVKKFSGDYDRMSWSMSVSQDINKWSTQDEGNSYTAAIDDNFATNLCLAKPGKTQSGLTCGPDEAIWFVVDMKVSQTVNYFRIHHRENNMLGLRWRGFEKIEGSNNGTDFEVIAQDVKITDWDKADQYESDTVKFENAKSYQYIKFYTSPSGSGTYFAPTSDRGSIQIAELYLGILPEE